MAKYVFTDTLTSWSIDSCHVSLAFSSDGATLAGTMAVSSTSYPTGRVQFWDTATGAVQSSLNDCSYVIFSPTDPDVAFIIGSDGAKQMKRASRTWSEAGSRVSYGYTQFRSRVAFSPDGMRVTLTRPEATPRDLREFDLQNQLRILRSTNIDQLPKAFIIAYCLSEPNSVVTGGENGQIIVVSYTSPTSRFQLSQTGSTDVSATAWSPDGKWLATGDQAGEVRLWNASVTTSISLSKLLPRTQAGPVNTLVFLPDSSGLLISCGGQLSVWDVVGGDYVANSGLPTTAKNIALDGPRNRLVVATDTTASLYEFKPKPDNQGKQRGKGSKGTPSLPSELVPFDITADVIKSKPDPFEGIYFDIYKGVWTINTPRVSKHAVAIKVVRPGFNPRSKAQERKDFEDLLVKCLATWANLSHDNLVPLSGVSTDFGSFPAMITSWMTNGLLSEYIESNEVDSDEKLDLVIGVASGVAYLHSNDIVHGDIRASSVLVDELGHARLADPGLFPIFARSPLVANGTINLPYRWMAPELLEDSSAKATTATDVYSVTMTSLEIFTGAPPFKDVNNAMVTTQITQGLRPGKPDDVGDELWSLWGEGWNQDSSKRPDMANYVSRLNGLE